MSAPTFYYDISSPYAYLAAARVDDVLPVRPQWRPIAFGVIVQRIGKNPWSFQPEREQRFAEIAARAEALGLPPVRYPEGWPARTYSLAPLRALMLADDQERLRSLTRELYSTMFVAGQHLAELEPVLAAAERAGMERTAVRDGIVREDVKERLRVDTDDALARGVTGVPTVAVRDQLFWGDDRLEDAAAALST